MYATREPKEKDNGRSNMSRKRVPCRQAEHKGRRTRSTSASERASERARERSRATARAVVHAHVKHSTVGRNSYTFVNDTIIEPKSQPRTVETNLRTTQPITIIISTQERTTKATTAHHVAESNPRTRRVADTQSCSAYAVLYSCISCIAHLLHQDEESTDHRLAIVSNI